MKQVALSFLLSQENSQTIVLSSLLENSQRCPIALDNVPHFPIRFVVVTRNRVPISRSLGGALHDHTVYIIMADKVIIAVGYRACRCD